MQHESSRVIDGHPIATRAPRRSQIRTRTTLRHRDRRGPRHWDREDINFYLHPGGKKAIKDVVRGFGPVVMTTLGSWMAWRSLA